MAEFNYMTEAGLYAGTKLRGVSAPRYRRFETAAEAVRFAIEEMPERQLRGSVLEVDEARFDDRQIRMLYDDPGYPLGRRGTTRSRGRRAL
ncbi:MAG: hypothetical protein AAAB20_03930 [Rhizobium sp.]|uniref:hypothetical protein n=1 Tax=Rhizobium sp. TaxID=391 RepID=UPI00068CCAD4